MHAHTYIYNAQEKAKMKFSCILNCEEKKNEMYVDGGRAMAAVSI
jgi:hypothetical protein